MQNSVDLVLLFLSGSTLYAKNNIPVQQVKGCDEANSCAVKKMA